MQVSIDKVRHFGNINMIKTPQNSFWLLPKVKFCKTAVQKYSNLMTKKDTWLAQSLSIFTLFSHIINFANFSSKAPQEDPNETKLNCQFHACILVHKPCNQFSPDIFLEIKCSLVCFNTRLACLPVRLVELEASWLCFWTALFLFPPTIYQASLWLCGITVFSWNGKIAGNWMCYLMRLQM